uniref:(northern house mosquito) hypothetical protein n=1 Tax=Culex pipiens TaxID=7175 RepID=A0A8D8ALH4_CULPI
MVIFDWFRIEQTQNNKNVASFSINKDFKCSKNCCPYSYCSPDSTELTAVVSRFAYERIITTQSTNLSGERLSNAQSDWFERFANQNHDHHFSARLPPRSEGSKENVQRTVRQRRM